MEGLLDYGAAKAFKVLKHSHKSFHDYSAHCVQCACILFWKDDWIWLAQVSSDIHKNSHLSLNFICWLHLHCMLKG